LDPKNLRSRIAGQKGQAAVEFVFAAPPIFFIFFALIQFSYMAFASLAVQKAAMAVARSASLSIDRESDQSFYKTQLALSLEPLSRLSNRALLTVLASRITVTVSPDRQWVTAHVHYPMPIWVPMVGPVFGKSLESSASDDSSPGAQAVRTAFQRLGLSSPNLGSHGRHLWVCWIDYAGTVFNEGYRPK
jgi:hypothetical protein